ncbi:LpqN/LpqT family lipoprotein [Nocardia callitridis]|uniref:LpqN/LpqT family lipoprotein n=1 Tax=Nocardia callitridis TaxID=648753 RepID=UPI003CD06630
MPASEVPRSADSLSFRHELSCRTRICKSPIVDIRVPSGWRGLSRTMFPGSYGVWVEPSEDGSEWADNAVLTVGRISNRINVVELLRHAFMDSRRAAVAENQRRGF